MADEDYNDMDMRYEDEPPEPEIEVQRRMGRILTMMIFQETPLKLKIKGSKHRWKDLGKPQNLRPNMNVLESWVPVHCRLGISNSKRFHFSLKFGISRHHHQIASSNSSNSIR